jgi:hypothetical protein
MAYNSAHDHMPQHKTCHGHCIASRHPFRPLPACMTYRQPEGKIAKNRKILIAAAMSG